MPLSKRQIRNFVTDLRPRTTRLRISTLPQSSPPLESHPRTPETGDNLKKTMRKRKKKKKIGSIFSLEISVVFYGQKCMGVLGFDLSWGSRPQSPGDLPPVLTILYEVFLQ